MYNQNFTYLPLFFPEANALRKGRINKGDLLNYVKLITDTKTLGMVSF